MAASRPLVTVQAVDGGAAEQTTLPAVLTAPIRTDVVLQVVTGIVSEQGSWQRGRSNITASHRRHRWGVPSSTSIGIGVGC